MSPTERRRSPAQHAAFSLWTVLTALAIGFGSSYPNLSEDNPARIAVGFGGMINFLTSAFAVAALIAIEASPYLFMRWTATNGDIVPSTTMRWMAHLAAFTFAFVVSRLALRMGERAISKMEF